MGFMASSIRAEEFSSRLRQSLQQPTTLSALISIGVHLALFAVLPLLPDTAIREEEPEIRSPVEVVELTPEEQNRLPEFSTPQVDLPPLLSTLPPSGSNLVPLTPLPNQTQTPLPSLSDLFSNPTLQQPFPSLTIPSYPSFSPLPPPPTTRTITPPATPQPDRTTATNRQTPNGARRIGEAIPDENAPENAETPEDAQVADNGETTAPAEETPTQPQTRSDEEITTALLQDVEARRRQIAMQQQLAYSQTGTAQDPGYSAGGSWTGWMQSLERWGISLESVNPDDKFPEASIEATYPAEVCEFVRETLSADYGVVVDPEGKAIGGLAVLRSSGYEYFNNLGGEAVMNSQFENPTGKNLPYQVTVTFPYGGESCPAEGTATAPAG